MKQAKTWNTPIVILGLITLWLMVSTTPARAATQRVLHEFDFSDGMVPESGVIIDSTGNLYGTTLYGGINNCGWGDCGVVFKLSHDAEGKWTETILHRFTGDSDGFNPSGALVRDLKGNLYGTTEAGGLYGGGTVFQLTPLKNGKWRHTILHSFGTTNDGSDPFGSLTFGRKGDLYGTTYSGGLTGRCSARNGCGVVFKLTPGLRGKWTEGVLYRFSGKDGANPTAGVFRNQEGRLYGATESGGDFNYCSYGCGVAFELTRHKDGVWAETVLHKFTGGADGAFPYGGLTSDHHGTFYGAAVLGGDFNCYGGGCGVVFKLSRDNSGKWRQTVLWTFNSITEGDEPYMAPILGPGDSLYGTTSFGEGYGNVYKLTPHADGKWTEGVLFGFNGGSGGWSPTGIVFDKRGNLYGTTAAGGNSKVQSCQGDNGCGLVYRLTP